MGMNDSFHLGRLRFNLVGRMPGLREFAAFAHTVFFLFGLKFIAANRAIHRHYFFTIVLSTMLEFEKAMG
jgi:hypothetical protein